MLTCVPLYAAIIAQFGFSFSVILFQTYLPTFLKQVLKVNLKTNGLFAILPFITQIILKNITSNIGDTLKKKKILTNTQAAKIFQVVANTGCAIVFFLLAFAIDCDTQYLAAFTLILSGKLYHLCICACLHTIE